MSVESVAETSLISRAVMSGLISRAVMSRAVMSGFFSDFDSKDLFVY